MLDVEGLSLARGSSEVLHDIHLQLPRGRSSACSAPTVPARAACWRPVR
jgi:ABC-type transporter Mla maintaining outer membrane lipid asymmetry ATPase subunit MlaF